MGYWYPAQERVEALSAELKAFEQVALQPAGDPAATIADVSTSLTRAAQAIGFPSHQLRRWIWIASVYRQTAAAGGAVAGMVGAALTFLAKRAAAPFSEEVVQDLNWVVETTTKQLCEAMGEGIAQSYLTAEETAEIERRLAAYDVAGFDADVVRGSVAQQTRNLAALSGASMLAGFSEKVEALFVAAEKTSAPGLTARRALLYLADENDVVRDSEGVLGLLDDVYVVDVAYAEVEQQTRCLALLQGLLEDFPYVADLALVGTPVGALDLYGQYVVCAGLESLFGREPSTLLVLRESGAFPLLVAFFAAVEASRRQAATAREQLRRWSVGAHVVIDDGATRLKVKFLGECKVGREERLRLGVDKDASLTASLDIIPYVSQARAPHKRLSSGAAVGEWLRGRHADPLVNLTGAARTRASDRECVLLLGGRSRLDDFGGSIRPLGLDLGAALGVRYVLADGRQEDLYGSATDAPYIYACSDTDTAHDLIRAPPEGVKTWRVVVDGAREMRALKAALSADGEGSVVSICVFSALFDREAASELAQDGTPVWYLEDQDVQPPPLELSSRAEGDRVERMLRRQGAHWSASTRVEAVSHPFLEHVEAWLSKVRKGGRDLAALELLTSTFLRNALARPFVTAEWGRTLSAQARGVAMQASVERHYSQMAGELYELFEPFLKGSVSSFDRRDALASLVHRTPTEHTAIVCRSARIADASKTAADTIGLGNVVWTNLEGVRSGAPFDRIIVPGWLDRLSMRELASGGYAGRMDLLFYPFEQRWFDHTMDAMARWERRIENKTVETLGRVRDGLHAKGRDIGLWREQTSARLDGRRAPPEQDSLVETDLSDVLDGRTIEVVQAAVLAGREHHPTVKARLVMFERPGTYAFLPGGGKVIVLDSGAPRERKVAVGDAENMLMRSVADLVEGDLVALSVGGDRDLIDARADQLLPDAAKVRGTAALWKSAVVKYAEQLGLGPYGVAARLATVGVRRHGATIRYWMATAATVAPRGFREVLPAIAALTKDEALSKALPEVLSAVDMIYRARSRAADAIVAELFAGRIDLEADQLAFELDGRTLRYGLHRIESLEGYRDVPHEVVGRVRRLFPLDGSLSGSVADRVNL